MDWDGGVDKDVIAGYGMPEDGSGVGGNDKAVMRCITASYFVL